jgi:hypothetical protein
VGPSATPKSTQHPIGPVDEIRPAAAPGAHEKACQIGLFQRTTPRGGGISRPYATSRNRGVAALSTSATKDADTADFVRDRTPRIFSSSDNGVRHTYRTVNDRKKQFRFRNFSRAAEHFYLDALVSVIAISTIRHGEFFCAPARFQRNPMARGASNSHAVTL